MKGITDKEVKNRMSFENPWWGESQSVSKRVSKLKPRAYLDSFYDLASTRDINRAVVLMGPRRVGKTVMIHHAVQRLIDSGIPPRNICYLSIEAAVYSDIRLELLVQYYLEVAGFDNPDDCYIFFDEIQYLDKWEVHLKRLVDDFPDTKFVASGSAAAALKMKSQESGAGRFTEFYLPPLTFYEYLSLTDNAKLVKHPGADRDLYETDHIGELNEQFTNYLNIGGFPEVVTSSKLSDDPQQFIGSDILDKVLLRDLPGLYGIQDANELYRFFIKLAHGTGNEVSLLELSKATEIPKNTIIKYLAYLEAAFLIKRIYRIDQTGKHFKRENYFKVYLTNPSLRSALFEHITADSEFMGNMVETALISQLAHSRAFKHVYYARWKNGEVDIVLYEQKIVGCIESKWSNRFYEHPGELKSFNTFLKKNSGDYLSIVTTIDKTGIKTLQGRKVLFIPTSLYVYGLGFVIMNNKDLSLNTGSTVDEKSDD